MGNVTSHLWWMECKRPLQHFWDPQEAAVPLSNVKLLFCNGHNPPPSSISCQKNLFHFQRFHKEFNLATNNSCIWTESEKKWSFAALFWVSHWTCWIFNHSFAKTRIFLWIPPWAAVADPGSETDLRLFPKDSLVLFRFGCSCYVVERPPGAQKRHFCTHVCTYVWAIYTYIPWGFTIILL